MRTCKAILSILLSLTGIMWLIGTLTSCSPTYVLRAAYEEGKILAGRRSIDKVIADIETPEEIRKKLQIVKNARLYAIKLGLNPKNSFTKYTKIDKDVLTWVVVGARPDSFTLAGWWFPIVGTVPYKGFFDREDADEAAAELISKGFETSVRGSEAFSTLGWFNDPVLTPTLKQHAPRIANLVLHESVHTTVWIKDNVAFNESLANFVGNTAASDFFTYEETQCAREDAECRLTAKTLTAQAQNDNLSFLELSSVVFPLYKELDLLYKSPISSAEKLANRTSVFEKYMAPLRAKYPKISILHSINNAEIIQFVLYMTEIEKFNALYERSGRDWTIFFDKIREIEKNVANSKVPLDPFSLL